MRTHSVLWNSMTSGRREERDNRGCRIWQVHVWREQTPRDVIIASCQSKVRIDPSRVGIDIEARAPQKTDQGDPQPIGHGDRQARRSRDRADDRHARDGGLLQDLEAGPPGYEHDPPGEREFAIEKSATDQFVDGVVAADVFTDNDQAARRVEEARGVQAPGAVEDLLGFPHGAG